MQEKADFGDFLRREYVKRCQKTPSYSVRAFALSIELNSGTLSQILSKKRKLTKRTILKISRHLGLKDAEIERFISDVNSSDVTTKEYAQISFDAYKILSEWFHFALLELVTVKGFNPKPQKVAQMLNITLEEASGAIERLVRLKLLEKNSLGELKRTSQFLTTTNHKFTNDPLIALQSGLAEKSVSALKKVAFDLRDHSSMTMAINSARLAEAKRRIKLFRRSLCEDLQAESDRDSVYQLLISFFPLTTMESKSDG